MDILKRLLVNEEGQDLVEYSLMIGLVVIGIWLFISLLGIPAAVQNIWTQVSAAVTTAGTT
jgi:Flp pilus assembly pilin Flp